MAEFEVEARVFGVRMRCDACFLGEMTRTKRLPHSPNFGAPVEWEHICGNCGIVRVFTESYPCVRHFVVAATPNQLSGLEDTPHA